MDRSPHLRHRLGARIRADPIGIPIRTAAGSGPPDYGWYWDSREPYGWATYHYGRWALTADYGWVWVPGAEWGPAWVDWRYGGGYAGWAPMPPEWGPQHDSYRTAKSEPEARAWVFVSVSSFVETDVGRHRAPAANNAELLAASGRVTNYASVDGRIVNRSIDAAESRRPAGIKIAPIRIGSAQARRRASGSRRARGCRDLSAPWC